MRSFQNNEVSFGSVSARMWSVEDSWGIDDTVIREIKTGSYNESEAITWWLAMLSLVESGSVVVDAGSYTGLYSLFAIKERPDIRAVAIEASSITYSRLVQNVILNGFDVSIVPCHAALSDRTKLLTLAHGFGPFAMASGESTHPEYDVDHSELVAAVGLDELLLQVGPNYIGTVGSKAAPLLPIRSLGAMKVDVEGAEVEVLKGAASTLQQFKPMLLVEILSAKNRESCFALLSKLGYEMLAECPGMNYVFCHSSTKDSLVLNHTNISQREGLLFGCKTTDVLKL